MPAAAKSKPKPFQIPKTPAACADLLYQLREQRYALNKDVDDLAKQEGLIREHLIATLPISNASGITGAVARVQIEVVEKPQVKDWEKFNAYVVKNQRFDLLQRRINETAVEDTMEHDKKFLKSAGVEMNPFKKVSCTKK